MITIKLPFTSDQPLEIKKFQVLQSPIIRSAYAQAKKGLPEIQIRSVLRDRYPEVDSWFVQSAVKSGMASFAADTALDVKSRIFGGKKDFIRRCKNLITNQDWKDKRLQPIYLIGEANQKGNRKFNFDTNTIVFKPSKGTKIEIHLPSLKKNYQKYLTAAFEMANNRQLPITISLTQTDICITFDDKQVKEYISRKPKPIENRYAGIDMNPNYIGVSVFDGTRLIDTKLFSLVNLTGKNINADKLAHETKEVGHAIGQWLTHLRVDKLFLEQLTFEQGNKGKGKNYNRLCQNQWKKETFKSILTKYFKIHEINAAYTSTIGNILHPELPDPIAASTAIAKRGYRVVILKNKQFYPSLPKTSHLKDLWKETEIPAFLDWKELHSWVKKSGMKYRVPIPDIGMFRIFASPSSRVGVIG